MRRLTSTEVDLLCIAKELGVGYVVLRLPGISSVMFQILIEIQI